MYNPSSSSRDDSASEGLPSSVGWASWHWSTWASDSSTFVAKAVVLWKRFIVGGLARCFLLASGGTRALTLQPLVAGHVLFVLLDRLIHLMGCQGTSPRNLRIQHVPDLLSDSVQGDLILEGFQLCLRELALPVLVKVAHGGAYPNHKVGSILLCPLMKVFDHVSLLTEREGAAIVLSQHLQQSGEVLGVSRRETPHPVKHIRGVSCQGRHHKRHEVRILVIIPVIGDAPRPLPKGAGYILRMSFLASEFRDLNFIREPIFLLTPHS